ncbi:MAG: hypothetical protein HS117_23640 [Verrucomicrobiaceae bacterium]|jgi:hypothetical protein|nr:hypothetical protein [Verrucomicrobiaceae bacterium]
MRSRALILLLITASSALACSVPVFRYALEHWEADAYRVTAPAGAKLPENYVVTTGTEPKIELRQPKSARNDAVIWSAPFSEANLAVLVDSPARKEVAERLGSGESAVWVFLESGDATKDAAALKTLEERLDYLGGVMNLPKLDEQDIKNGLVSIPGDGLRLAFSIVKVKRDDPAEAAFIAMLLASEEDLRGFNEPMAFPIFGQGRALYALVGKGIRPETIDEAAQFLIGSCSCQVKEQNPGMDIAMAVDWKQLVKDQATPGQKLPELKDMADLLPQTVTIKEEVPAAEAPLKSDWKVVIILVALVGGVLVLKRIWTRRA